MVSAISMGEEGDDSPAAEVRVVADEGNSLMIYSTGIQYKTIKPHWSSTYRRRRC